MTGTSQPSASRGMGSEAEEGGVDLTISNSNPHALHYDREDDKVSEASSKCKICSKLRVKCYQRKSRQGVSFPFISLHQLSVYVLSCSMS